MIKGLIYGAGHKVECGGENENSPTPGRNETSTELQTLKKFGRVCDRRRILRVKVQQVFSLTLSKSTLHKQRN